MGSNGDSNSPCSDPNLIKRIGDSCTSDSQCISNICSKSVCIEPQKVCPADCSGHGQCNLLDASGNVVDLDALRPQAPEPEVGEVTE